MNRTYSLLGTMVMAIPATVIAALLLALLGGIPIAITTGATLIAAMTLGPALLDYLERG